MLQNIVKCTCKNGLRPLPFGLWATSDASCIPIYRMITAPAGCRAAGCHSGCNGFDQVPAFKGPSLIVYKEIPDSEIRLERTNSARMIASYQSGQRLLQMELLDTLNYFLESDILSL
jgi:hypothetical protein